MSFRYAGFWARAIAEWIDLAILVVASTAFELAGLGALFWLNGARRDFADAFDPELLQASIGVVFALCAIVYFTGTRFRPGFTLGQRVLGLRVVKRDGSPISFEQSLLRTAASFLSMAIFGAGYWLAALHPEGRTLHDLLAGTVVIETDAQMAAAK